MARKPRSTVGASEAGQKAAVTRAENREQMQELYAGTPQVTAKPSQLGISDLIGGVSLTALASIFHLDKKTVSRKIGVLKPVALVNGSPVWAIADAAPYLCNPVVDMDEYLQSIKPKDLPVAIQKDYWDAMLKRQKWEETAGFLFRAEDVAVKFGECFKLIKNVTRLWVEDVDRVSPLDDDQRIYLDRAVRSLLDELHMRMVEQRDTKDGENTLSEIRELGLDVTLDDMVATDGEQEGSTD